MEEIVKSYFRFENEILVSARTIDQEALSDEVLAKLLGWAIFNDMIWSNFDLRQSLSQVVTSSEEPASTRLFVALLDNPRLTSDTLQRFVKLYERQIGTSMTQDFQICIAQREELVQRLLDRDHVHLLKDETTLRPLKNLLVNGKHKFQIHPDPQSLHEVHLQLMDLLENEEELVGLASKLVKLPEKSYDEQYQIVQKLMEKCKLEKDQRAIMSHLERMLTL